MTDLLEETTRDFRDEQKIKLFKKLLPYIIVCSALIAAGLWYNDSRQDENTIRLQQFGDKYLAPYVMGNPPEAVPIATDEVRASELLLLKRLSAYLQQNEKEAAMRFARLALEEKSLEAITKGFFRLTFVNLALDQDVISEQDQDLLQKILGDYGDIKQNLENNEAFAISIYMAKVIWQIKAKEFKKARSLVEEILAIQQLSDEMRMRAVALKNEIDRLENVR